MKKPIDVIESEEYIEPNTFENDREAVLFYSYLELANYVKHLENKLCKYEKREAQPPQEFFDWLVTIGELDRYEAALEHEADFTMNWELRNDAREYIDSLTRSFNNEKQD